VAAAAAAAAAIDDEATWICSRRMRFGTAQEGDVAGMVILAKSAQREVQNLISFKSGCVNPATILESGSA
jgi:hypothetical protein